MRRRKQKNQKRIFVAKKGASFDIVPDDEATIVTLTEGQVRRIVSRRARLRDLRGDDPVDGAPREYPIFHLVHLLNWLEQNHPRIYKRWNTFQGKEPTF